MRSGKMRSLFVFFLALGLIFSTVSILPAARSATGTCLTKCNTDNKDLKNLCKDAQAACLIPCKELAKNTPERTACENVCFVARAACDATAAFLKEQCKLACPRGQSVSGGGEDSAGEREKGDIDRGPNVGENLRKLPSVFAEIDGQKARDHADEEGLQKYFER